MPRASRCSTATTRSICSRHPWSIFAEGTANKSSGGNDLHGAYGSITKVVPNATIEPYALWRLARGTKTETGLPGKTDRKVYGARFVGKLPANFDYNIEAVGQTGSVGTDDIQRHGVPRGAGLHLPKLQEEAAPCCSNTTTRPATRRQATASSRLSISSIRPVTTS